LHRLAPSAQYFDGLKMKGIARMRFRTGLCRTGEKPGQRADIHQEENTNMTFRIPVGLACAILLALGDLLAARSSARPRPPGPPYPESGVLSSFRFDNPNQLTNTSLFIQNVALVDSWSGQALSMEGESPKLFFIPAVEQNGKRNFNPTNGTIRLWAATSWSSLAAGGAGPGGPARLFEVGTLAGQQSLTTGALQFSPTGDAISFVSGSQAACVEVLTAQIQWEAGTWHQIALAYSAQGSWLFLDGQLAATGPPVALTPPQNVTGTFGLALGSDLQGNPAQAQLDELSFFTTLQAADNLAWNFTCLSGYAALGPITPEEDAVWLAQAASARGVTRAGNQRVMSANITPPPFNFGGTNPPPPTHFYSMPGLKLTRPAVDGSNATMTVVEGTNGLFYDLFCCTNLLAESITNSMWTWLGQVTNGQTFTLTNQPSPQAFYLLGTPQDSDADLLTDAFELLVSKTDPLAYDTAETVCTNNPAFPLLVDADPCLRVASFRADEALLGDWNPCTNGLTFEGYVEAETWTNGLGGLDGVWPRKLECVDGNFTLFTNGYAGVLYGTNCPFDAPWEDCDVSAPWPVYDYVAQFSRAAHTELELLTGGPALSRRPNLFQIHATVWERDLYLGEFGPEFITRATNLPPGEVAVLGQSLDANGDLLAVLPDSTSANVTQPSRRPIRTTRSRLPRRKPNCRSREAPPISQIPSKLFGRARS
jgi:hypothetical protein